MFFCVAVVSAYPSKAADAPAPPDAESMIEKSVAASEVDFKAEPGFNYRETDRTRAGARTYQVTMIDGSPYRRLIAVNGHPLPPAQASEEQSKQDQANAQRESESPAERAKRIDEYQLDRNRNHAMLSQLTKAFRFELVGSRKRGSFNTWLLRAIPRPGYQPPNMETQALRGMEGQLWLDQKTYQWVRVTARVVRPVSIAGFLARVEPGTRFELDQAPVADNIWLKSHFTARSRAAILFLFRHSSADDETYFDFQPVNASDGKPISSAR
jgi:hypothetical protein